jgi:hypothetical protein
MQHLEGISAKTTFNSAIVAVRRISVSNNDLPGRLADVLAQLKARNNSSNTSSQWQVLDLKVRSRMSMSVTFDSLWHWRKGFEVQQSAASIGRQTFLGLLIQHGSLMIISDQAQISANTTNGASTLDTNLSNLPNTMEFEQDFDFDNILFDDFYPLNWMTENTGDNFNA